MGPGGGDTGRPCLLALVAAVCTCWYGVHEQVVPVLGTQPHAAVQGLRYAVQEGLSGGVGVHELH